MKIHDLASKGDCLGVQLELQAGVSVDARDERDYTPLACALSAVELDEQMVQLLIKSGADVNAALDGSKEYPLGIAACSGSVPMLQTLLDAGANVNFASTEGYTVLIKIMYALSDSATLIPIADTLIKHGALLDCETCYGESPVTVASIQGRFDALKYLLDSGADPSPLGWTELMMAVAVGTNDDVEIALTEKSFLDPRDSFDRTAWLLSAYVGDVNKTELLFSKGAELEQRGRNGGTALLIGATMEHVELVYWLIDHGADIEATDDMGNTSLMIASQSGNSQCVQILLEAGAIPTRKNEFNETAKTMASNESVIRMLTERGEDLSDIRTEMKRMLTGLHNEHSFKASPLDYSNGKARTFGRFNSEVMENLFWRDMVRTGVSAYSARKQFDDLGTLSKPIWCFDRFGMSFTELPDGTFVQIGGEHEDFYDPDFCIYNDVIVHDHKGNFEIRGYPEKLFPPTDFHSATFIDGFIFIVGALGYCGSRRFGTTPIYRLNCDNWQIENMESSGENPGWIFKHKAVLQEMDILKITGGTISTEIDGQEKHIDNEGDFYLNLSDMSWSRSVQRH